MTDFASLGIQIDASQVSKGVSELDKLTAAGGRAEGSTNRLKAATATGSTSTAQYAGEVERLRVQMDPLYGLHVKLTGQLAEVSKLYKAGAISAGEFARANTFFAQAAEKAAVASGATAKAISRTGVSAGQQRVAMQQLSFQIGDVSQQFALGVSPMRIFAQQGGQVVQAIGLMSNSSKGLIGFLAGPWGAVLTGAVILLGSLSAAHSKASEAADTQKDAAKELADAIDALHSATIKETQSAYAATNASIAAAGAYRERAIAAREAAIAELTLAKAGAERARQAAGPGSVSQYGTVQIGATPTEAARLEAETKRIQVEIDKQTALIGKADQTIRGQRGKQIAAEIAEKYDASAAAAGKYARQVDTLSGMLRIGVINEVSYRSELEKATVTRDREIEAAKESAKHHKKKKEALTDEQKAYERAKKATDSYIESLSLEIEKIGATPAQIRAIDVAHAKEGAATDAQRQKIVALSAAREKAMAITEAETKAKDRTKLEAQLLEPLQKELALLGLTGDARERAALKLDFEGQKAKMLAGDLNISTEALQKWYDTSLQIIEGESAIEREARAARDLVDSLNLVAESASTTGQILSDAFGGMGDVFGNMLANLADYRAQHEELAQAVVKGDITQENADKRLHNLQVKNTAQAISGIKGLFKEHSAAYKVMGAVEKAYAAFQAAQTALAIARDIAHTASSLANSAVRTGANTAEGGSKIFAQLGVWAFPVVAAMVAVLAALGAKGGGGGGGSSAPSADDLQAGAGTGTVLGDSKAKSNSIANSLEIVAANTNKDLEYSNGMLKSLRSIDFGISKMAGTIAKQIQVSGSLFDTSGLNLGSSGSGGFLGIGKKSTTRSLFDLGLDLNSGSLSDIIANGIAGQTYQIVEKVKTKSGFLGIGGGTKTSHKTTYGAIDAEITAAISEVLGSLRDGIVSAAKVIGLDGAEAILASFQVSIGRISFKDMTGEQIEDQLNAIFSSVGDQMAQAVFPTLTALQKVGEGLFETFMRVAREYEVVDFALMSIGKTFGQVGISSVAARDALVQLFGGLDEFVEQTDFFRDQFLSEAEQITPVASAVRAELTRLGMAGITTRDQFKQAVLGLDLTTAAGREMYASLLAVAPAFDKTLDYFDKLNKTVTDGLKSTIDQFGKFAESLRKYRDTLFSTGLAQGSAYTAARAQFIATSALAANGDATALGGLESSGKSFLDAAKNNASSLMQYQRDVALVAQGVDKGIFAAEAVADYAQLQLDALTNAVTILGTIATNTSPTVTQPVVVTAPGGTAGTGTTAAPAVVITDADTKALLQAIVSHVFEQKQILKRWDRGDTMAISADDDTPLNVNLESWG